MQKKWVWFDLDDTLHDQAFTAHKARTEVLAMLAEKGSLPIADIEKGYQKAWQSHTGLGFSDGRTSYEYRYERFRSTINDSPLTEQECDSLADKAASDYEHLYMENLRLKSGAVEVLSELRQSGYGIALLTNAPYDGQMRVIKKLGLTKLLDGFFASGDLKISKKGGMMKVVLDRLNVSAENVMMIGDSLEQDIEPALLLHIKPVWFNDKRLSNDKGYTEIYALDQIPAMIEAQYDAPILSFRQRTSTSCPQN